MSMDTSKSTDNPTDNEFATKQCSPEQLASQMDQITGDIRAKVRLAAKEGDSFNSIERKVLESVLRMGHTALELFIRIQGEGDLGEIVPTEEGKELRRSEQPVSTRLRSLFGEHEFMQYTYSPGVNKRIELRPISARMELPENRWSYLLQEFSQTFCTDQAYNQAAANLETFFGAKFSVDTLEQTNLRMGPEANEFMRNLPTPEAKTEGEILVAQADGKGVPLLKKSEKKTAAFEAKTKRPGNRRMATVASVYTVDPFVRTAEEIVDALFRDKPKAGGDGPSEKRRPRPQNKHTCAHFPRTFDDAGKEVTISGIYEAMAWIAGQARARVGERKKMLLLMDGQTSLWNAADVSLEGIAEVIEILDVIHVSTYVWEAGSLLAKSKTEQEKFTRERLQRILAGDIAGVVRGLRCMGTQHKLKGKKFNRLQQICGYFETNAHRMRYDEYLKAGYPIASGVIEGACCHLVKDRMERSGMRWTLEGARSMLDVRAAFQSDYWHEFCKARIESATQLTHPHRNLLTEYQPLSLSC